MRRRPSLVHLEAFVLVAEHMSFRKAAQQLHMSQPALSRCIQSAEEALETKLFDRDTRNVSLTSAGVAFLPIARRLLMDFQNSIDDVAQHLNGSKGNLSIAALPSVSAAILPEIVSAFAETWPEVKLSVTCPHHNVIERLVTAGEVDFGISMLPSNSDKLDCRIVEKDEFVLVCGVNHPLASFDHVDWKIFEQYPHIELSPTTSMFMLSQEIFERLKLNIKPAYQIGGMLLMAKLIADGHGITAVPRLALPLFGDNKLRFIPLRSPTLTRSIGVLTRKGKTQSVIARNFLETLYNKLSMNETDE